MKPLLDFSIRGKPLHPNRSIKQPPKPSYRRQYSDDTLIMEMLANKVTVDAEGVGCHSTVTIDSAHELKTIKGNQQSSVDHIDGATAGTARVNVSYQA